MKISRLLRCALAFLIATIYSVRPAVVTLVNGAQFKGTIISENDRFINLSVNGAPVSILKQNITSIDTSAEKSSPAPVQTAPQISREKEIPDTRSKAETQQEASADVKRILNVPVSIELKNGSRINGYGVSEDERVIEVVKDGARTNVFKKIIKEINGKSYSSDLTLESYASTASQTSTPAIQKNIDTKTPSQPQQTAKPKSEKRYDGKTEITLKNGTSFTGKINSENQRFIALETNGTTINILKALIQKINGEPYSNGTIDALVSAINDSLKGRPPRQSIIKKDTSMAPAVAGIVKPNFPKTDLPPGITTEELVDSLHSRLWQSRSLAARRIGAMGQWAFTVADKLTPIFSDTATGPGVQNIWSTDSATQQLLLAPGYEAARAIAQMGPQGFTKLSELINSPDYLVRVRAAYGLGQTGDITAVKHLNKALLDTVSQVRIAAIQSMRFESVANLIIPLLKDSEADVRAQAASMLGELRDPSAVSPLMELLYDKRSGVRAATAEALGKIGGAKALIPLLAALKDGNLFVRENAARALGETKDTLAVAPLIEALKDESADVRANAADALSKIRDPRAIPSLYAALKDSSSIVIEKVSRSLEKHTEINHLIEALTDESAIVRENAVYILWLMTGKDIGDDKTKWQQWFDESKKENELLPGAKKNN